MRLGLMVSVAALVATAVGVGCGSGGGNGQEPDGGSDFDGGIQLSSAPDADVPGIEDTSGQIPIAEGRPLPGQELNLEFTDPGFFGPLSPGATGQIAFAANDAGTIFLLYGLAPDRNGTTRIIVRVRAENTLEVLQERVLNLVVAPVNDPPVFDPISPVTLDAGSGAVAVITGIGPGGGPDEVGQPLAFRLDAGDPSLFDTLTVSAPQGGNDAGAGRGATLQLQGAAGRTGTTTIQLTLDDGEDGGVTQRDVSVTFN